MEYEKCNNDEVFLGNTSDIDRRKKELSSIESLRIGSIAYDIHGKKIKNDNCKPLFLHKNDMRKYDNLMMAVKAMSKTKIIEERLRS